ncbi:MAG: hypothetical protein AAB883_00545 [Patescibacteria group bacterium]
MIKKRYAVPALILGITLLGSGTAAYAAFSGPGTLPSDVLSAFTPDEQVAIKKAQDIRSAAETEAESVLTAAGVTEDELHTAMEAHQEKQRTALNSALDANDYAAYQSLVADAPNADKLTEDVFAKLVQIRKLEVAGDKDGAMTLRKELGQAGFGFGGHGGHMGPPPTTDN